MQTQFSPEQLLDPGVNEAENSPQMRALRLLYGNMSDLRDAWQ